MPFSLSYSTIVDIFNQLSGGHVVVTLATGQSKGLELEGRPVEVTEWREAPRRRLERRV